MQFPNEMSIGLQSNKNKKKNMCFPRKRGLTVIVHLKWNTIYNATDKVSSTVIQSLEE